MESTTTVNLSDATVEQLAAAIASATPDPLPVQMDSTATVSIATTLPISVQGLGSFDSDGITSIVAVALLLAGVSIAILVQNALDRRRQ